MTLLPHLREFVLEAEAPTRRNRQAERSLLGEVLLRLRHLPVLAFVTPNGLPIPVRSAEEGALKARIIRRMRDDGMMQVGAPDLVLIWAGGCGLIELKRPAHRDIFGYHPAGQPSEDQKEFAAGANALGINHAYCRSADAVLATLRQWGAPV